MILGCDAAGIDADGNEVVLYSVIGAPSWRGADWTDRSLLTERYQGTFADRSPCHLEHLPKPKELSFEEAACLPTAWLTAYRMLFTNAGVRPGDSVLVQGAGGGVATAAIVLGKAAGLRVFATSRDEAKRDARPGARRRRGGRAGRGCRSGWTRSSRRSAPPPGRTPSSRSAPADASSSRAPPAATTRSRTSGASGQIHKAGKEVHRVNRNMRPFPEVAR